MGSLLIKQGTLVNEGELFEGDIYIKSGLIHQIGRGLQVVADQVMDARGKYVLPGVIDDQVHFREPGLTHKANIFTESRAAVAGGITTFMEMPNTVPQTLTQALLEAKYQLGGRDSLANFSFYMGASNDNLGEVKQTDPKTVCGIKVFMGSSTGNMLVDDAETLEAIFRESPMLIATHCEDEHTIRRNLAEYIAQYGEDIPVKFHPLIRSAEACYLSSSRAVALAKQHGARLHILHISTAQELDLFENHLPLEEKRITAEACIHHLWFSDEDYPTHGTHIKWNPAVKTAADRQAIRKAVKDGRIDVIATDHAPHTLSEKDQRYTQAPSGGPMVQHALTAMLELTLEGEFTLNQVVEKMCHAPAICFQIDRRGFIREGYHADLVIVDPNQAFTVSKDQLHYKCGWSPMEGLTFHHQVESTLVNGQVAYHQGTFNESIRGQRIMFNRP